MVHKHQIGCKVIAHDWDGEKDLRGMTGILRTITEDGEFGLVEYQEFIGGSCDGTDEKGKKIGKAGHCHWHRVSFISVTKQHVNYSKKVERDYKYRGRNLKGKPFRFLGAMPDGEHAVVEFQEDVGGHSADGHGKRGRCLIIPVETIKK